LETQKMRRLTTTLAAAVVGLMAVPAVAAAANAVTTERVSMRAGPSVRFPVVDVLPDDARVTVFGCVRAYAWCDISWRGARGWVPGDELAYFYRSRYVPIIEYGPSVGLPIIVFSVDTYWNRHYRGRPWYGRRAHWRSVWRDRDRDRGAVRSERRRDRAERRQNRRESRADARRDRSDRSRELRRQRRPAQTDRRRESRGDTRSTRPQASLRERRPPAAARQGSGGREGREGGGSMGRTERGAN
jgi:uncharacterized protein YraI